MLPQVSVLSRAWCVFLLAAWVDSSPAIANDPSLLEKPAAKITEVIWEAGIPNKAVAWSVAKPHEPRESFSVALWVRLKGKGDSYPCLAGNKGWNNGEVVDLLSTSNMGKTLSTGTQRGWVLAVQPNGSWLWNLGNGKNRLDYLPTAQRQPILDDRWHLLSFSIDVSSKEARLFYDGRNVAIYAINGFENQLHDQLSMVGGNTTNDSNLPALDGKLSDARIWNKKLSDEQMFALYQERFPQATAELFPERVDELKVLSWNIWHGARHPGIEIGIQQAIDFIKHTGADVITMQETYGSGPTIADRLGYYFYLRSSNLSIMSRYPLEETHDLYEPFRLGGATVRLSESQRANVFSLWIHYLPAWRRDASAQGANAEALISGEWETRASELRDILRELKPFIEQADRTPLIIGGDFNSPSKLDWTDATADWHQGLAIDWPVSKQMLEAGFIDSYRQVHRDPRQHQEHDLWDADARKLTYRIDYVYPHGQLVEPVAAQMMNTHNGTWPSDHPAVLTTLRLKRPPLRVISYNILEGFRGAASGNFPEGSERRKRVSGWLASQHPDVVAFQELNGYTQQQLQQEAATWGHPYAVTLKEDGYIVGLTSKYAISVIERLRKDMHHGMLHCRSDGVDYFVVHLSPFRFRHRQREVQQILQRVKQSLAEGRQAIVLGDFNAYSPADRANYDGNQSLLRRLRSSDERHDHVANLDRNQIDYSVIQSLLDAGLTDLYAKHRDEQATARSRIDYIYASAGLAERSLSAKWFVTEKHRKMSDHVPVSADVSWPNN